MPTPTCRLLPFSTRSGPENMAADEVMLQTAERGIASLRFYAWSEPTLSLGYFQAAAARLNDPLLAEVAWLRRPSGGGAILHHHELTYCLALPAGKEWPSAGSWICRFHDLIRTTLATMGVTSRPVVCGEEKKLGDFLCFLDQTPGDLLIGTSKIVGSAQRKRHGAIMQHGSILLGQSPLTPSLPGIAEVSGAIVDAAQLAERLGTGFDWVCREEDFTDIERPEIVAIAQSRYEASEWNEKR